MTIIDYELKSISRIAGYLKKDEKFINEYIKSKIDPNYKRIK
jgi:hypothetical protein